MVSPTSSSSIIELGVRTQGALSPHCGLMHSAGYLCMYIITHVRITHPHVTSQELLTALTANPLDVSD